MATELETFHWKLRPNCCRWRHGYYWQPIGSRQYPIRWHHCRPATTYHLATLHPWRMDDIHANSFTIAQVRSAKNVHYHTRWWSVHKPHHRTDCDHAKCSKYCSRWHVNFLYVIRLLLTLLWHLCAITHELFNPFMPMIPYMGHLI